MPIYKTAHFQVKAAALAPCQQAVREFIAYVQTNEPGTSLYRALQEQEDPTRFLHYFIFDGAEAKERHRTSEGVKRFTATLYPELESGRAKFVDYMLLATTGARHDPR